MTNLEYILDDIALGEMVYILHPKKYQIQPLSYGKLGIKFNKNDNPFTTDTPQGTIGHVADSCPKDGDLENLTGYYYAIDYFGLSNI